MGQSRVKHRIILAIRIQVQSIAAVSILLGKAGDDRIVEPRSQVILLRNRIKLLAGKLEAVGDGFLLGRKVALQIAAYYGRFCGAKRPQCEAERPGFLLI